MLRKYMWARGTCGVEEQRTHGGGADVQSEDIGMRGGWPCLCLCFWPRLCDLLCAGGLCHVIRTSMPDRAQMWRICAVFFWVFPSGHLKLLPHGTTSRVLFLSCTNRVRSGASLLV